MHPHAVLQFSGCKIDLQTNLKLDKNCFFLNFATPLSNLSPDYNLKPTTQNTEVDILCIQFLCFLHNQFCLEYTVADSSKHTVVELLLIECLYQLS